MQNLMQSFPAMCKDCRKALCECRSEIALLAQRYRSAPEADRELWRECARETDWIFALLTRSANIRFRPTSGQPYGSAKELRDAIEARFVKVTSDYLAHPVWSSAQNWRFRCVHDVLGHALGEDFSFAGEEQAFQAQAVCYPTRLRPVLFSEIVGQAAVYFDQCGVFGDQRIVLI